MTAEPSPMSTKPPRGSKPRPASSLQRQRKRLRGWLMAAGLPDPVEARRLAAALIADGDDTGVAGWIERAEAWLRREARSTVQDRARALGSLAASDDPAAKLRGASEEKQAASHVPQPDLDFVPLLPASRPKEMKRQPLGQLPAVLRGGAWVLSARWASPKRVGPRIPRSLWSWRGPAAATPVAPEEPAA